MVLLLSNPVFYLTLVTMVWDRTRSAKFERRFFGVRVTKVWSPMVRRFLLGIFVGVLVSIVMMVTGVVVRPREVWVLAGLTVILSLIRLRFAASGYGIAVLLALTLIGKMLPLQGANRMLTAVAGFVANVHVDSWLGLAALLFLAEAALLKIHKRSSFAPAVVTSKRGRSIGAAVVQLPFLIPVVALSPGVFAVPSGIPHSWPWLGSLASGFTMAGVPLLAGFGAVLLTLRTTEAVQLTLRASLLTGVLLAINAVVVHWFGAAFGWIGIIIAVMGRELPVWLIRQLEGRGDPLFSPGNEGVRILTTREGSLAETMGLLPAELVTHVNQVPVHSNYDLHFAFDQNPAYAKLQVVDRNGEVRIVGKPVYTGELNQLGLILAPDQPQMVSYRRPETGLFQTLYLRSERPAHTLTMGAEDPNYEV